MRCSAPRVPASCRHRRAPRRPTPTPNASSRTVRSGLLDLVIVVGRRHLISLLHDYEAHCNRHRPHRGIGLDPPEALDVGATTVPIEEIRRTRSVGGMITEYRGVAA
jgi:putative transposase